LLFFVTTCNFDKLLFTGPRGPGFIFYSLWDGGKGCTLILFSFIFWTVEREGGGWRLMFLFSGLGFRFLGFRVTWVSRFRV
jgi:hypothetical protein